jgi:hypothetical protein
MHDGERGAGGCPPSSQAGVACDRGITQRSNVHRVATSVGIQLARLVGEEETLTSRPSQFSNFK